MVWLPFVKPFRFLLATLRDLHSPRQISAGIAIGMVIGLVPKENLTAAILGVLLMMLRVNLAAGMLSALAFSWIGFLADPVFDRVGYAMLASHTLSPYWNAAFQLPVVPWTALNNTVVMGSLLLGVALAYPLYHVVSRILEAFLGRYGEPIGQRLKKYRLYQIIVGADVATSWRWSE